MSILLLLFVIILYADARNTKEFKEFVKNIEE
jgi:hypothetical protein